MAENTNRQQYAFLQTIKDPHVHQALRFVMDQQNATAQIVKGPVSGTLDPDQKPQNLGTKDAGTLFYATDYDRTYKWTGSAWTDAPGSPPRNHTAAFLNSPSPPTGWAICNGQQTSISTTDGRTEFFKTPVVPPDTQGFVTWVRL